MCRFAAYVGPAAPLSTLLYDQQRSLQVLAYDPREMLSGTVNVDGTGLAWWSHGDPTPLRYASPFPPWSDPNLPTLAARLIGHVQLAAVRSATPGMPFGAAAVAPFVHDRLAGVHNGWIGQFRAGIARSLLDRLPADLCAALEAVSDSTLLFMTIVAAYRESADLAAAVRSGLTDVAAACRSAGADARLNVAFAEGRTLVAARASEGTASNSLYVTARSPALPDAVVVASEPLDDRDAWSHVPDDTLLVVEDGEVACQPLGLGRRGSRLPAHAPSRAGA